MCENNTKFCVIRMLWILLLVVICPGWGRGSDARSHETSRQGVNDDVAMDNELVRGGFERKNFRDNIPRKLTKSNQYGLIRRP